RRSSRHCIRARGPRSRETSVGTRSGSRRAATCSSNGSMASSIRSSRRVLRSMRRSSRSPRGASSNGNGVAVHTIVQAVILGVLIGGVYALMASGLTLVFGIMKVINVAQGALVILAAYLSYALFSHLHVDPFLSVLVVTPAMFVLGVLVQLVFVRSLRGADSEELSLLVTWALALGIEGVLSVVFKTTYRSINPSYANTTLTVLGYQ